MEISLINPLQVKSLTQSRISMTLKFNLNMNKCPKDLKMLSNKNNNFNNNIYDSNLRKMK